MKYLIFPVSAGFIILSENMGLLACPQCRLEVKNSVYDDSFFLNLLLLMTPILIISLFGLTGYFLEEIMIRLRHKFRK
jgi:hypothetical protein